MNNKRSKLLFPLIGVSAGLLLILTVITSYLAVAPISPLQNWTISTDRLEYTEGESVKLTSRFDKTWAINGKSTRTLVCIAGNREQTYSPVVIDADAPKKDKQVTESSAIIPSDVIDSLPKECYYKFNTDYIYGFRAQNKSNVFIVNPKEG